MDELKPEFSSSFLVRHRPLSNLTVDKTKEKQLKVPDVGNLRLIGNMNMSDIYI